MEGEGMGTGARKWRMAGILALGCGLVRGGLITGCGGQGEGAPEPQTPPKLAVPGGAPATPQTGAKSTPAPQTAQDAHARLHQPFHEATLAEPPGEYWLLDKTKAGKSVGKL